MGASVVTGPLSWSSSVLFVLLLSAAAVSVPAAVRVVSRRWVSPWIEGSYAVLVLTAGVYLALLAPSADPYFAPTIRSFWDKGDDVHGLVIAVWVLAGITALVCTAVGLFARGHRWVRATSRVLAGATCLGLIIGMIALGGGH